MMIPESRQRQESLMIHGEQIKKVIKYKYLGAIINEENDYTEEIKSRIGQARSAFNKMKNVLCSVIWDGSMDAEKNTTDRLEAFELWAYRKMLRISWVDRITNDAVLRKQKEVLNTIKV